jgi:predicted helicase
VTALQDLLDTFRKAAKTNREAGTYFEELTIAFLRNEPFYKALYREVMTYAEWAGKRGLDKRDSGIDVVAETATGDVHAIQCKLYSPDYELK